MIRRAPLLLCMLALAACQKADDDAADRAAPTAIASADGAAEIAPVETGSATPAPAPEASATQAAAPAAIRLAALQDADGAVVTDNMQNVGGCTFSDTRGRSMMLVGLPDSDTDKAVGVARIGGRAAKLTTVKGGRAYVDGGPRLTFENTTLAVKRAAGEGRSAGMETQEWDATLTVRDSQGASQSYRGSWACGV